MSEVQERDGAGAALALLAIDAAIAEVGKLAPDRRLTAATVLLEKARKRVADFRDGEPGAPLVDLFVEGRGKRSLWLHFPLFVSPEQAT